MSSMTTMTKTTTATPSSSGGSTTSGSSNNRLKQQQQQQQHTVVEANLIKEGKFKLKNAILTKNRNEMKEALIILSKTKLTTTTTTTTHKTSIRSKCNPQDDDDDDVDESSDDDSDYDEDGSDYDEEDEDSNNTGTFYYYTEYQFCSINLSYDSSLLSECIFGGGGGGGRSSNSTGNNNDENDNDNDISTDMVRLLVMPFKVVEQMSTPTNTTTTTTVISTNAGSFINGPGKGGGCFISSMRLLLIPPLIRACQYQNYNLVRLLLELDITDPNIICGADGLTPLIRMSKIGDLQMIKLLLLERNDVNIYHYDQQSMNALIHACTENHIDIVRYLLDYSSKKSNSNSNSTSNSNSNLEYVNDYKVDPPIWYACAHGNAAIVRLLIDEYGAKIRYRIDPTIYSSTPFMEACEWGHLEVVKIILERDQNTYNHPGTTSSSSSSSLLIDEEEDETRTTTILKARELARSAGYNKVVELIDFWSLRIQNIENTFINNSNCNSLSNDEVDDNDNDTDDDSDDSDDGNNIKDDGNEEDDCVNENENENEVNNNSNDNKKKQKKNLKNIDVIPPLLPIVLSMTAKRYDITYRIISRHQDIICSHQ